MSAPAKVRTTDGMVWELRAETRGGLALYALEGVCKCPPYVMATLQELAEHGVQGAELAAVVAELGALPVPVGSVVSERVVEDVTPQVQRLRSLLAGQREAVDGEHYASVHHTYRVPRDLPEREDPARCLKVHSFSPRDGWRMVCGNCDHGKDASCHQAGGR